MRLQMDMPMLPSPMKPTGCPRNAVTAGGALGGAEVCMCIGARRRLSPSTRCSAARRGQRSGPAVGRGGREDLAAQQAHRSQRGGGAGGGRTGLSVFERPAGHALRWRRASSSAAAAGSI
eukprot:SAG31_NODE_1051_length_10157_cov_203.009048_2_plen_120_part_00